MNPAPVGTSIRIVSNHNHHHYRIGGVYRVHKVDGDGTLKAVDSLGVEGDYLLWGDCQPAGLGWNWLRQHLDARSLDLLSAFDGLDNLALRDEVEARVVAGIPDLAGRILELLPSLEQQAVPEGATADDGDSDELDELDRLLIDAV